MNDLISRSKLIADLEAFKVSLGDIVLGWVVDRVIERVRQAPGAVKKASFSQLRPVFADNGAMISMKLVEVQEDGNL